MYDEIKFPEYSTEILEALNKGAFLTVKSEDKVNTMTISWGTIGIMWGKPTFMAMVRHSRYTFKLIEKSEDFTVSLPFKNSMKEALAYCGSKSGENFDKIKECNLKLKEALHVNSPVIDDCEFFIECKIAYKQDMDKSYLASEVIDKCYSDSDYHVLYFGEIKGIYKK